MQVTLRDIASRIFATAFKEKLKFLQDTFLADDSKFQIAENSKQAIKNIETYEKFKTKLYPSYVDSIES